MLPVATTTTYKILDRNEVLHTIPPSTPPPSLPQVEYPTISIPANTMAIQETDSEESKITTLLTCFPHDQSSESLVHIPRFRQRLSILSAWSILPGSRVLDIGCGQGESALVLALELGPTSHVTGIDNAPPDYGTPLTISESQEKILQSPLGDRLAFHIQVDAASFFNKSSSSESEGGDDSTSLKFKFDAATACHSLFYFPSYESVASLFRELATAGIRKVYVAEYDKKHNASFLKAQTPHILAAKAQALFYAYKSEADSTALKEIREQHPVNIRAAPDVESITKAAQAAGFRVGREGKFTPEEEYQEGHFEARYTTGVRFEARVKEEEFVKEREEEILGVIGEVREAYEEMEKSGVEKVRCMDVWWAEFELE